MAKQILSEQAISNRSVNLVESVNATPGCLGTIYGICADYKEETRNGNYYSRKLWENVFNDDLVKESLQDKILFGELGHPQDRLETDITKACIVMRDYEFDDNEGVIKGHFDILNTPCGKIFRSLLDYGCVCGLSSRGEGDIVEEDGMNKIDEDTYYFVGFDAVALPAVKKAKPSLQESVKRQSLKESIIHQVESVSNKSVLNTIKQVIENAELPESDSIMESINIKSKELEGVTDSSNLIEDLENAVRQLDEVKQENIKLKESVNTFKGRLGKVISTCTKTTSQIDTYKEENKKLRESLRAEKDKNSDYEDRLNKANERFIDQKSIESQIRDKYVTQISKLNESLRTARETNRQLEEDHQIEIDNLNKGWSDRLSESNERYDRYLEESKQEIKDQYDKKYSDLESQLTSKKDKLNESLKKQLAEKDEKYSSLLKDYAKLKSQVTGLDQNLIIESIQKDSTSKSIDTLVESIIDRSDRYRSISSIPDPLFSESGKKTGSITEKGNSDTAQFKSFMEQAMKMI